MTKKIQITDLIPFLKPGFVAMDSTGEWYWYKKQPKQGMVRGFYGIDTSANPKTDFQALSVAFDIEKSEKEWDQTIIKVTRK